MPAGTKVFNRPVAPIKSVRGKTRLLLFANNPCDVLYDPFHNTSITMNGFDLVYSINYPSFKKLRIPVVDYHFNTFFGLSPESIQVEQDGFTYGDLIVMKATQVRYSFDYYEIHPPITVKDSKTFYTTLFGYTASFDPNTSVYLTTDQEISGSGSPLIAHYR